MAVPRYLRFFDDLLPFEGKVPKMSSPGDAGELRPEESLLQGNDSRLKVEGDFSRVPVTCLIYERGNDLTHKIKCSLTRTMDSFNTITQPKCDLPDSTQ